MRILLVLLSILSFLSFGSEIETEWKDLDNLYNQQIQNSNYNEALKSALKLNRMDPSDTTSLLYIVYSSIKSNTKIPCWVFEQPWPNRTNHDILNRLVAEHMAKGR